MKRLRSVLWWLAALSLCAIGHGTAMASTKLPRLIQQFDVPYPAEHAYRSGRYLAALPLLERELAHCTRADGCFDAAFLHAGILVNVGRHAEAQAAVDALVKRSHAIGGIQYARALMARIALKFAVGAWGDIMPTIDQARATLETAGLGQTVEMAEITMAHGMSLVILGRRTDGMAAVETAIGIYRRLGRNGEDGLATLLKIAAPFSADPAARYAEGEAIMLRLFGPDAPSAIEAMEWRAEVAQAQGRLQAAETILRNSVEAARRATGEQSFKYALANKALAEMVEARGGVVEAIDLYLVVGRIMLKNYGAHPLTAQVALSLGSLMLAQGYGKQAEEMLEGAHLISRRAFGENSPQTALTALKLGTLRLDQTRYQEANHLLLQARNIGLAFGSKDTLLVLNAELHLALLNERLKHSDAARDHYTRAVAGLDGAPLLYIAVLAYANFGRFEVEQGNYAKGRTLLRICEERAHRRTAARVPVDGSLSRISRAFKTHVRAAWALSTPH